MAVTNVRNEGNENLTALQEEIFRFVLLVFTYFVKVQTRIPVISIPVRSAKSMDIQPQKHIFYEAYNIK